MKIGTLQDRLVVVLIQTRAGVLAVGMLLIFCNRVASLVLPFSLQYVIDEFISHKAFISLWPIVAALAVAIAVESVTSLLVTRHFAESSETVLTDLRIRLQQHLVDLPITYHTGQKNGVLLSLLMNDVEGVRCIVGERLVKLAGEATTALLCSVLLLRLNPGLAILTLLSMVSVVVVVRDAFYRNAPLFSRQHQCSSEVAAHLSESLQGIRDVKMLQAESRQLGITTKKVKFLGSLVVSGTKAYSRLRFKASIILSTSDAVVLIVGAFEVYRMTFSVGRLLSFIFVAKMLESPVRDLISLSAEFGSANAGLERVEEVLAVQEEERSNRQEGIFHNMGAVSLNHIYFSYSSECAWTLEDITICAQPGSITAIVGPSGAGKSTLLGIIGALYFPSLGTVSIDGIVSDAVTYPRYRSHVRAVFQETYLFDTSIFENVNLARPEATQEAVLKACVLAHVDEFVRKLPEGYATMVGERGVKLSAGQRQRIAIARTFLAEPRVLVLDEFTSNLDAESEALVMESLSTLVKGRTTFVVAHRLTTTRTADHIIFLENGRVSEQGTHKELIHNKGRYYTFYMREIRHNTPIKRSEQGGPSNGGQTTGRSESQIQQL